MRLVVLGVVQSLILGTRGGRRRAQPNRPGSSEWGARIKPKQALNEPPPATTFETVTECEMYVQSRQTCCQWRLTEAMLFPRCASLEIAHRYLCR